jgi:hypothetical protein
MDDQVRNLGIAGNVVAISPLLEPQNARARLPPWTPPLTEFSDFVLWTRRRQIAAPPELLRLPERAIALGLSTMGPGNGER